MQGGFFPVGLSVALATLVFAGCDPVQPKFLASTLERAESLLRRKPPLPAFPILDAEFDLTDNSNQVFWLDNDRVLFDGVDYNALAPRQGDGRLVPKSALFIWDTRTNQVARYGDIDGRLCYADGYVNYLYKRGSESNVFREGRLGAEVDRIIENPRKILETELNELTCRDFRRKDFRPNPDQAGRPLRDGHGFLHLGPWDKLKIVQEHREEEPIHLHREGGNPPVALPMDKREASHLHLSYSAFSDAYLLYSSIPKSGRVGIITNWPRDKSQPLYVMRPDGRTTVIDIPYHVSRSGLSNDYWLVRPGVFMTSGNVHRGVEGGYLVHDGRFIWLMRGSIRAVGVSPDGCKVAVGIKPTDERERRRSTAPQLKMVNVCAGGPKK